MDAVLNSQLKILCETPADLFQSAKAEALQIDWNNLPVKDMRSRTNIFKSSTSNHLRVHKINSSTPDTLKAHAEIIECVDTSARKLYPAVDQLVTWIIDRTEGFHLGRIMLVNLHPHGEVGLHKDLGSYFQYHYRFHVPITTNPGVLFSGPDGTQAAHMPSGHLCQLHNQNLHGVKNNSAFERIHLILDIATQKNEFKYLIE